MNSWVRERKRNTGDMCYPSMFSMTVNMTPNDGPNDPNFRKNQLLLEMGHDIKHDTWNQLVTCRTSSCVHSFCSNVKMLHSFLKLETITRVFIQVTCIPSIFVLFMLMSTVPSPQCPAHGAQHSTHICWRDIDILSLYSDSGCTECWWLWDFSLNFILQDTVIYFWPTPR